MCVVTADYLNVYKNNLNYNLQYHVYDETIDNDGFSNGDIFSFNP